MGIPLGAGMMLVTLGVVYGDIGTSPMYVMKSIISGNGGLATIGEEVILGALSLVIWTLTLVTTVKYVLIAMRADNHNEGGIFALYSLVRHLARWLIIPAIVGGAALLADGILTPAVTVTTAIEGLRTIDFGYAVIGDDQIKVMAITLAIIVTLFLVQRAGTANIGKAFGPIMLLWFLFLGITGLINLFDNLSVLRAFNPARGIMFLFSEHNRAGMMVLGFIFLCTTGAEALYSDMGHVGRANVNATWPFVKACLILNYLGQGAWILANQARPDLQTMNDMNPFFQMLPEEMRPFAVVLSTLAAIIASQALITGSFTLVSEASRLNLMPHMQIHYPSDKKGQLYIPVVNYVLLAGCVFVVLLFRTSSNMEAAYGLAITVTMLMTTILLFFYISGLRGKRVLAFLFLAVFGVIESSFFLSSLTKFPHGGYVTVIMTLAIAYVMYVWRRGTAIESSQTVFLPVRSFLDQFERLRDDTSYPLLADNLVFLTNDSSPDKLDRDILYSIFDKHPKRARAYWFINIHVTDRPDTRSYSVENFGTNYLFKIQINLGFRVNQRVNQMLRQVVRELMDNNEIEPQKHPYSIYVKQDDIGDFRFCMIRKLIVPETSIAPRDLRTLMAKYTIRRMCGSPVRWYGLENSAVLVEYVPLFAKFRAPDSLERVAAPGQSGALNATGSMRRTSKFEEDDDDIISIDTKSAREELEREVATTYIGGNTAQFKALRIDDEENEDEYEDEEMPDAPSQGQAPEPDDAASIVEQMWREEQSNMSE